jgi:triacylglycerol esterase/lipase EstA (alpha/beta hydrolase family)
MINRIFSLLVIVGGLALSGCAFSPKNNESYPVKSNWTSAFLSHVIMGQDTPAGVNQWSCRLQKNQYPVVLVHGTFSNSMYSFGALGPALANKSWCVFSNDFGGTSPTDWFKGVAAVDESAKELASFIEKVKTATSSHKVILIGHSQGGLIGFYYLKFLKGHTQVDHFLALAPSVNGTTLSKTPNRDEVSYCVSCADQHPDSELIEKLKDGKITMPGVRYTVLATLNDKVVIPVENQFVREPGVLNMMIQDRFPGKRVSHSGMLYDPDSLSLILELLGGNAKSVQSGP